MYQVKIICHVHLRLLSVSGLWPFDPLIVFTLILYNLHYCILINVISHSEFSQDDVLGTGINVPPF